MNYRPPGPEGRGSPPERRGYGAGHGRPVPPRDGGRMPPPSTPPANAGRVVGRPGDRPDPYRRPPRTADARWEPRSDPRTRPVPRPPHRPPHHPPRRPVLAGAKVALTVLSVLVLAATGYYWGRIEEFRASLTTADVIGGLEERPADGAVDILMVGMDSRTDARGNPLSDEQLRMLSAGVSDGELNTDTLIMIRIPNDGGKAYAVSMPRDSYVDIPGYGEHKINSAYLRAKNDAMERLEEEGVTDDADLQVRSNRDGAKKLIATVEQLTGATIDRYAEVNLLGFYDITKAIGGIEVCLKAPVDDWRSGARFPAGKQNLSGVAALAFVRQRHGLPNGDLDRIVRQQVFLNGMAKKVFSQDLLAPGSDTLDRLQDAIGKSVVLSKDWNVVEFAQDMMDLTGGKMSFQTIPVGTPDLDTPEDGSAVEVDPDEVQEFVAGLVGTKATSSPAPPDDSSTSPSQITVNVRNATGQTGLADSVASSLADEGFTRGEVGNAQAREQTVVRHAAGEQALGEQVAESLGGSVLVEQDENLAEGSVTVLLGSDFSGPGTNNGFAAKPLLRLDPARTAQQDQPDANGCVN